MGLFLDTEYYYWYISPHLKAKLPVNVYSWCWGLLYWQKSETWKWLWQWWATTYLKFSGGGKGYWLNHQRIQKVRCCKYQMDILYHSQFDRNILRMSAAGEKVLTFWVFLHPSHCSPLTPLSVWQHSVTAAYFKQQQHQVLLVYFWQFIVYLVR